MLFAPFRRGPLIAKVGVGLNPKIGGAGSQIKSIQYGTITIADPSTTGEATITAVVVANSAVGWLGLVNPRLPADEGHCSLVLTDATTVTATRTNINLSPITGFRVIEFTSVVSREVGTITIAAGATSNTATIGTVVLANTLLFFGGWRLGGGVDNSTEAYLVTSPRLELTNTTTVTALRNTAGGSGTETLTIPFTVIQVTLG